ncbi:MAG: DUF4430 domain-containing protein [Oscillospiraceae bacterium]
MKNMSKKTKTTIIAVVAVILLAAVALLCWKLFTPAPQVGSKTLTIEVTHGNGEVNNITLSTDAEYLWDAMAEQKNLIEGTDGEYGKWVTTVDGEKADEANGQYWMFTKGGEWVETSCDTTPIADGEGYEFFIYAYSE